MTSNQNICYCGEYGGGAHTKSARCADSRPSKEMCRHDLDFQMCVRCLREEVARLRASAEPSDDLRREWNYVRRTLVQCQEYLQRGGVRHTWIDSAIDIAAARASVTKPESAPNTKGSLGSECNRAFCENMPATWKHKHLHNKYYCKPCAMRINEANGEQLCTHVEPPRAATEPPAVQRDASYCNYCGVKDGCECPGPLSDSAEYRARINQPTLPPSDVVEDAAKWRALRNCARITAIGSAGCHPGGATYEGPSAHVTLNFWTHNARETEPWHREWLDTFVAKARAAVKP